ncbi:MAG: hypothetical protein PV344_04910 [Anaplasma sp.]|nr:hypothetical protein [Anaplasma sp.]
MVGRSYLKPPCKRLNFREDLILANFANRKKGPANNLGNMSTLRKLHWLRKN